MNIGKTRDFYKSIGDLYFIGAKIPKNPETQGKLSVFKWCYRQDINKFGIVTDRV